MKNIKQILKFCLIVIIFISTCAFASRVIVHDKSCLSNVRIIQGAIEMYNMDNSTMIERIEDNTFSLLVNGGYLKRIPKGLEKSCEYKSMGNMAENGNGIVFCTYHGDREHLVSCYYYDKLNPDLLDLKYEKIPQNISDEEFKSKYGIVKAGKDKAIALEKKGRKN